jgi:phosphatidylglycerol:prolipoprotein diacylglycerol transferase
MLPILHLGPLAIQTPGVIILLGIGLGLSLMERQAVRYHVNGGVLYNIAFAGLLAGVASARLAYVAHYPSAFLANPGSLFSLNLTMFEPAWGIVLGLVISGAIGWRKRIPLYSALDAFTSTLAVLAIAFHLANLASGDAYGMPTNVPWAIELWGTHRHPVQIYETLGAILILWLVWPRPGWYEIAGQRFLVFFAMSAGARLFLEAFRGDSVLWGGIRSAQVITWLILAVCLWFQRENRGKTNIKPG